MLPSNMVLTMGNGIGFNNNILVSNPSLKLGINELVKKPKTSDKRVIKKGPAVKDQKLPYGQPVLSQHHRNKIMTINVLSVSTFVILLNLFK